MANCVTVRWTRNPQLLQQNRTAVAAASLKKRLIFISLHYFYEIQAKFARSPHRFAIPGKQIYLWPPHHKEWPTQYAKTPLIHGDA
jgi:hypothetical protein